MTSPNRLLAIGLLSVAPEIGLLSAQAADPTNPASKPAAPGVPAAVETTP